MNEYSPEYILFFSAKRQKLIISSVTGRIAEKDIQVQFQTADELNVLITSTLGVETLRGYHKEGLIIVDNLESLPSSERLIIKEYIEPIFQ